MSYLKWPVRAWLVFIACAVPILVHAQETLVRPAKVFEVVEVSSEVVRSYPAITLPSREVELTFRVSGRVVELPVRAAVSVAEGDMIARLDLANFETDVAQLESQRDRAAAELRALRIGARSEEIVALRAAVDSAQAQVDQALDEFLRTQQLFERDVVAQARLDQDEAALRVAQANLQAQQENLAIGLAGGRPEDIDAGEAALRGLEAQLQVAVNNLGYATLKAPFDGIIARRHIDNFTNVQTGQNIVLLQSLSTVHLAFDVPGPDVTALSSSGVSEITNEVIFDALPDQVFPSEVVEFSVQADSATQTYRGRVAVDVPEGATILPGMVGRVISRAPGDAPDLVVPLTAIAAAADGRSFVWIVNDANTVSARDVELGEMGRDMVAVTSGLEAGEIVVAAGVSKLLEGMQIRPITEIGG